MNGNRATSRSTFGKIIIPYYLVPTYYQGEVGRGHLQSLTTANYLLDLQLSKLRDICIKCYDRDILRTQDI